MAEKFTVAISIKAIDAFSQKFDQINQKINKVSAPFKDLNRSLLNLSKVSGLTAFSSQLGATAKAGGSFFNEFMGGFKKLGAAVGIASAAFGYLVKSSVDSMSAIDDASQRLGISAEKFQELRFAATQTGIDLNKVEPLLTRLSDTIGDAALGTGKAADIFNAFGISARNADGSIRGIEEVLPELADKFKGVKNETLRNQIAMNLFGKEGVKFSLLLSQGSEGLNKFAEEARDAGLVMSKDGIQAGAKFGDILDKLSLMFENLRNSIAVELLPVLEEMFSEFQVFFKENKTEIIAFAKEFAKSLPQTISGLAKLFGALFAAVQPIIAVFNVLSNMFGLANVLAIALGVTLFGKTIMAFAALGKEMFLLGTKIFPLVINGFKLIALAFSANPIGATVVAIAALIGLGVLLYKKWEPFKILVDGIWEKLKSFGSGVAGLFGFGGGSEAPAAQAPQINAREIVNRQIQSTTQKQVTENKLSVDFSNIPRGTKIQSEPADFMDVKAGFSGASF